MAPASDSNEKERGECSEETPEKEECQKETSGRKLRPRESLKRPSSTPMDEIPAKKAAPQRSKALETIFEEPIMKKNGNELFFSAQKRIRALKFPDIDSPPPAAKVKHRRSKVKSFKKSKKLAERA